MIYTPLIRPLLFRLTRRDPEKAHEMTIGLLHLLAKSPPLCRLLDALHAVHEPMLETQVWGLRFPNPVGLAGGFDKDGMAIRALAALGFGFLEVGTVTLRAQPGNPRPRVLRLPHSRALINRMGFNNAGAPALAKRLAEIWPPPLPLGVSLGKNKTTPEDSAAEDYCAALRCLHPHLDYFAVNISSPNTPGLRNLQGREALSRLLTSLQKTAHELAGDAQPKPLVVKIAPDLNEQQISELLGVCLERSVAGIIATNTTLDRSGIKGIERTLADEVGGLSGRPLTGRVRETVAFIRRETDGNLPIIGVGGIQSADDALRLFDAGASLVQLYTGLIYQGPGLVKQINRALLARRAGAAF
jgi:dihydroorotate dehydrogenase